MYGLEAVITPPQVTGKAFHLKQEDTLDALRKSLVFWPYWKNVTFR